ncbi:MAG: RHS repeat-associated protein [Arenicella sp.]|jgi:RHS repeat-associated protein
MSPAGRNGIKPNLSLAYSSSQGNGSLGVGWGVSGLSAITRCGQTQATNGKTTGVMHGSNDRFCMGGQQLRMVAGSVYGAAGSEYRTEVEQFSKIEAVGSGSVNLIDNGTAPTSWKVWGKDGRIYTYGATADSRLEIVKTGSTKSTHSWGLNQVEDRSGNYYTVKYRTQDSLPDQIDYTFNSGLSANQRIKYVYETRPDQRTNYLFGRAIQKNVRLQKLTVTNNGSVFREYRFDYQARTAGDLRPSRLDSIEECGLSEICLPKIPVAWQTEVDGFSNSVSTNAGDTLPTYLTKFATLNGVDSELSYGTLADVNGDGLTDLVIAVVEPNGTFKAETHLKTATGWQLSPAWKLPKAIRSYDQTILGIAQFTQSQIDQGRLVDVNGDGLVDLVYSFEHFTDASQESTRLSVSDVYLNSETGFETTPSTSYVPPKIGNTTQKQVLVDYTSNGSGVSVMRTERTKLIDLNGDGLLDWVTAYYDYVSSNNGVVYKATHLNTGSGWNATADTNYEMQDYFVEYIATNPPLPHGEFQDINSDGLVDWVQSYQFLSRDAAPIKATWLNTGSGWQKHDSANSPYVAPELIYKKGSGAALSFKRGSFIDLNADGMSDWVVSYSENSNHQETKALINTGRGWITSTAYKPDFVYIDYTYSNPGRGWPVNTRGTYVDVNRDGLVDYVEAYRPIKLSGVSQPEVKNVWLNTGSDWVQRNDLHPGWLLYDYDGRGNDAHKITVSSVFDVNSDGSPDWVKVREGELATRVNKQSRPNQLESLTTNMGVTVKPTLESLSAMPGLYTRIPQSSITGNQIGKVEGSFFFGTTMYVTSTLEVTRPDDLTEYNQTTYHYGGAQINRKGRGFLGFYDFSVTSEKGITTRTEYHQAWPFTGSVLKSTTENADGLLSQSDNVYDVTTFDASNAQKKRVFPYLETSTTKAYELNGNVLVSQQERELQYDANGNVDFDTSVTKSPSGSVLAQTTTTKAYYGYGSGNNDWPVALVDHGTTVFTKPNEATVSNFIDFDYYANGQLQRVSREPNAADPSGRLITDYVYDTVGNIENQTVKRGTGDLNGRVTHYEYDGNKRLPEYLVNDLGHRSRIQFHAVCDTPAIATDANQIGTSLTYNDFCLEKTATAANGVVKTTTYKWAGSQQACSLSRGCQTPPALEVSVAATGQASVSTLYNHYMKSILVITQGMDQTEILQTSKVDRFGRTIERSQPFFSNSLAVVQTFEFDGYDRPTRSDLPFNTYPDASNQSEFAYISNTYSVQNGNSVVSIRDPEGKLKHTHTNASGQMVKVVDHKSQVMLYRYNAQGNLKETQDHLGNVISIKYDLIGRRTELDDPDLGISKYRHSSYGEIIEQEDAEGLIIYTEYDQLGRMKERRVPIVGTDTTIDPSLWVFDVSEWTYDQGVNKNGLLSSVITRTNAATTTEATSYEQTYGYDLLNRLASETTVIQGQSFTQNYTYNGDGQLSYREFPSSGGAEVMGINLNYDNGYLASITDKPLSSASCIEHWRATKYDALGRLTEERLGKFITTKRLIDNAQGVVRGIQSNMTIGNQQMVQDLVYDYDATNNVKLRLDQLTGVTEEFDYDDLHRLLEHKRDGNVETTVLYDAIGNITYKSDVGNYHYDGPAGPHALSSVTLPMGQGANLGQFAVSWDWDGAVPNKSLPTIHGQTFTYDKKGSIEQSGSRRLYWTAFSKPHLMIAQQAGGDQHGSKIEYDANFNRMLKQEGTYSSFANLTAVKETTYYVGKDYERIENQEGVIHRYHIKAGSHAIQIERKDGQSLDDPKYMLSDNLGSTNVIINKFGKVEQRLEFDPWGMRTTASPLLSGEIIENDSVNDVTTRGYTGHEMDDEVGLINMNARIYDPYLGRFLSADPVLPDAGDMQQFNRYSYVTNNPLKYTDPTGNIRVSWGIDTGIGSYGFGNFLNIFAGFNESMQRIRDNPGAMRDLAQRILSDFDGFRDEAIDAVVAAANGLLGREGDTITCIQAGPPCDGEGGFGAPQSGSAAPGINVPVGNDGGVNIGIGLPTVGGDREEQDDQFIFTNDDGLKTLKFFFESVKNSPAGSIRGINPDLILDRLSGNTQLTDRQLEIALEIATTLTVSVVPGRFLQDAARLAAAIASGRSIATVFQRGRAILSAGLFANQVTLERDLRGHLNTNFNTFKRGSLTSAIFGEGLNGAGRQAFIITRNLLTLPGSGDTPRVQQLVDEFGSP